MSASDTASSTARRFTRTANHTRVSGSAGPAYAASSGRCPRTDASGPSTARITSAIDISDASRLDAELSRAETGRIDLAGMLETLADIHNSTGASDHAVCIEGLHNRPIMVDGMESRLAQVFRNLIANAASFSPVGGAITVTLAKEAGRARIDVDDQGPGIPAGKEAAIFDRFYSQRPETEKFGTHSGLGLSISKQIVDAHEGSIVAENRLGPDGTVIGARFRVELPLAK